MVPQGPQKEKKRIQGTNPD